MQQDKQVDWFTVVLEQSQAERRPADTPGCWREADELVYSWQDDPQTLLASCLVAAELAEMIWSGLVANEGASWLREAADSGADFGPNDLHMCSVLVGTIRRWFAGGLEREDLLCERVRFEESLSRFEQLDLGFSEQLMATLAALVICEAVDGMLDTDGLYAAATGSLSTLRECLYRPSGCSPAEHESLETEWRVVRLLYRSWRERIEGMRHLVDREAASLAPLPIPCLSADRQREKMVAHLNQEWLPRYAAQI